MNKRKICWITPDYYLDVDSFIVPQLSKIFDIEWILISTYNTKRNFHGILTESFRPEEFKLKFRQRDPRILWQFIDLLHKIKKYNADLIYISYHGFPYFYPIFVKLINLNKVILGVHNVRTPKGASIERWMDRYQKYIFKRVNNFHVFSKYQLRTIEKLLPDKTHYYTPLTLTDYGRSNVLTPSHVIRFLFFGYIKKYKRLDLLIKSFHDLQTLGINNIELVIAGDCDNFEYYNSLIAKTKGIKTRIGIIPNKDIPDLVSSCHYMVLPYQDGAQSGVITIAYQYNKPVIVSDIEAFKQFVIDGSTGFYFKKDSQESLTAIMKKAVINHEVHYQDLKNNIELFVKDELSTTKILLEYERFLLDCITTKINASNYTSDNNT
jgi:glycosyltransferase involved in cell wall biosynthesis